MMRHPAVHIALVVLAAVVLTLVARGCGSDHESELPEKPVAEAPIPTELAPAQADGEAREPSRPQADVPAPSTLGPLPALVDTGHDRPGGNPCIKRSPAPEPAPVATPVPPGRPGVPAPSAADRAEKGRGDAIPADEVADTAGRGPRLAAGLDDGAPAVSRTAQEAPAATPPAATATDAGEDTSPSASDRAEKGRGANIPAEEVAETATRGPMLASGLDDGGRAAAEPTRPAPGRERAGARQSAAAPAGTRPCMKPGTPVITGPGETASVPRPQPAAAPSPEPSAPSRPPRQEARHVGGNPCLRDGTPAIAGPPASGAGGDAEPAAAATGGGPMLVSSLDDGAPQRAESGQPAGEARPRTAPEAPAAHDGQPTQDSQPTTHDRQHAAGVEHDHGDREEVPARSVTHEEQHARGMAHDHPGAEEEVGRPGGDDREAHLARMRAGRHADLSHVRLDPPDYPPPEKYRDGKNLYEAHCHTCHGDRGTGTDRAPPLLHPYYDPNEHGDEYFYNAVAKGAEQHLWEYGDMPALPYIQRDQVSEIIGYVRWLQRQVSIY